MRSGSWRPRLPSTSAKRGKVWPEPTVMVAFTAARNCTSSTAWAVRSCHDYRGAFAALNAQEQMPANHSQIAEKYSAKPKGTSISSFDGNLTVEGGKHMGHGLIAWIIIGLIAGWL